MSGSREAILNRVREALAVKTDAHVRHAPATPGEPAVDEFRGWLPAVGESHEDRVRLFVELSEKLRTSFMTVADRDEAAKEMKRLAIGQRWTKIATHDADLPRAMAEATGVPVMLAGADYDVNEMEAADAGVTGCDALIAQTGSVLVTARSAGGRALSVLPPHHVVIATADQLVADLAAGYAVLRQAHGTDWPSFISFITGPSRTGDIERILVLGAHGPKQLTVILIDPTH